MENEEQLDAIDRKALLKTLDRYINPMPNESGYEFLRGIATAITEIEDSPAVDAMEVVHARWVKHKPKPEAMRAWHRQGVGKAMSENSIFWTCSCCEEWGTPRYNYCPNCGAKMDGGNEDDSKRMARKA